MASTRPAVVGITCQALGDKVELEAAPCVEKSIDLRRGIVFMDECAHNGGWLAGWAASSGMPRQIILRVMPN